MVLRDNLNTSTVQFFRRLYPLFSTVSELTTVQMAEASNYTEQAVVVHRDRLTKLGYLIRVNYRKWRLNPNALQHPLLTVLLSLNVKVYRDSEGRFFAEEKEKADVQLQKAQTKRA